MTVEITPAKYRDRFDVSGGRPAMKAVVTSGNGGYDKLVYRDVPLPTLLPGEVLLQVLAAGVNNTEINTRLGWYSESVKTDTASAAAAEERQATAKKDGGWNEATSVNGAPAFASHANDLLREPAVPQSSHDRLMPPPRTGVNTSNASVLSAVPPGV